MQLKLVLGMAGGYASYLLGGWDTLLETLIMFIVIDFITGMMASGKKGTLSSARGWRGICKKVMILSIIAVATRLDMIFDKEVIRNIAVAFYLVNEGLSIIENALTYDVPIPDKLKEVLKSLLKIFNNKA